jgi:hypothetical protein
VTPKPFVMALKTPNGHADKYLKLLRNYQGYYLVALLISSDVAK